MSIRPALSAAALGLAVAGCGLPGYEESDKLSLSTDITKQTILSALCSRGNSPFTLAVAPDGTAVGKIAGLKNAQGKPLANPPQFPARLTAQDKDTALLEIPAGPVSVDPISEAMKGVVTGGQIVLRGDSFDCTKVRVRELPR